MFACVFTDAWLQPLSYASLDMRVDVSLPKCVETFVETFVDTFVDTRVDLRVDMCVETCYTRV